MVLMVSENEIGKSAYQFDQLVAGNINLVMFLFLRWARALSRSLDVVLAKLITFMYPIEDQYSFFILF